MKCDQQYTVDSAVRSHLACPLITAQTAAHQWILFYHCSCIMDDCAKENGAQLVVRSGKSEDEVTNNRRLRSSYCILLKLTTDIHEASCDLSATAEFLVRNTKNYGYAIWSFTGRVVITHRHRLLCRPVILTFFRLYYVLFSETYIL